MTSKYLFDTYALIEIIKGNDAYANYIDEEKVINESIFAEISYVLFRDNYKDAKKYLEEYKKLIQAVKPEWIIEAMEFRLKWKDRKVSMTDCIGYIMAKNLGIKFLTGDKEFEDMENVEFVK